MQIQGSTLHIQQALCLPSIEMRRADQSRACYHTHTHDEFSFGVIDAGHAIYHNRDNQYQIHPGDTVYINPNDSHSCNPAMGIWSYRMLFIEAHYITEIQQEIAPQQISALVFERDLSHSKYRYVLFNQLFEVLAQETNPLLAESLLIEYFHSCFARDKPKNTQLIPSSTSQIYRAREQILDQLGVNLNLEEISQTSGLNRFQLIRSFKHSYGQTPHAFQLDQRIKTAKALLKQGQTLIDIASDLGFSDQSHFQRNFKKRMAVSPKQYQNYFN